MFIKAIQIVKTIKYLRRLKLLQEDLHNTNEVSKLNYHSRITYKLTHILKKQKSLLGVIKKVLNNKNIPLIPLLFHGNDYVTDFKKKAELLNSFFAEQFSLTSNNSELPLNRHYTTD